MRDTPHTPPSSPLLDHLTADLDRKLKSLPLSDRVHFLARAYGNWTIHYGKFMRDCSQPFGGPHPEHGPMTAWDFSNLLLEIQKRQREIEAVPA